MCDKLAFVITLIIAIVGDALTGKLTVKNKRKCLTGTRGYQIVVITLVIVSVGGVCVTMMSLVLTLPIYMIVGIELICKYQKGCLLVYLNEDS